MLWADAAMNLIAFCIAHVGVTLSTIPLNQYFSQSDLLFFPTASSVSFALFLLVASLSRKRQLFLPMYALSFGVYVILFLVLSGTLGHTAGIRNVLTQYLLIVTILSIVSCIPAIAFIGYATPFAVAIGIFHVCVLLFYASQISLYPGYNSFALTSLTFWALLPTANALLDYGSWAVSRKLAQGLIRGSGRLSAIGHIAFDVLLAALFLVLLAGVLPAAVQGVNSIIATPRFTPQPYAIPLPKAEFAVVWAPFLEDAIERPFTAGFAVTAMLATTLIPTALHLAAAVITVMVAPDPGHAWAVRTLRQSPLAGIDQVKIVCWFEAWAILSIALVFGVCALLWWLVTTALEASAGLTLVNVACWSARLVSTPGLPIPAVCLPGN